MNPSHLLKYVIRPTLERLDEAVRPGYFSGPVAEALVLGTAMVESNLEYLHQVGGGPAIGLWQMEPATFYDIQRNYLAHRPAIALPYLPEGPPDGMRNSAQELHGNLYLGAAMCRIHYKRVPEALPALNYMSLATYWKRYYNSMLGAGTIEKAIPHFERAMDTVILNA